MATASSKHVWAGASVLATLLTCVLHVAAKNGGVTAFVRSINGDAFTADPTSVTLEIWYLFSPPSEASGEVQTVPPAVPNTYFGEIDVYDVPIFNTSDVNAPEFGRGHAALFFDEPSLTPAYMNRATLVFNSNSGFPDNSSINLLGVQPWDVPPGGYNYTVVGGTGAFACASGVATDFLVVGQPNIYPNIYLDIIHMVVGCGFKKRNNNAFYLFGSPQP